MNPYQAYGDAACLTLLACPVDTARSAVLQFFGADETKPVTGLEAVGGFDELDAAIAVVGVAGGTLAVEHNGYRGSLEPILNAVSTLGATASVYWNFDIEVIRLSWVDNGSMRSLDLTQDYDHPTLPDSAMVYAADWAVNRRHSDEVFETTGVPEPALSEQLRQLDIELLRIGVKMASAIVGVETEDHGADDQLLVAYRVRPISEILED